MLEARVHTVTLNTRLILPQQQQQQRKISAGKQLLSWVFMSCYFTNVSCYKLKETIVSRKKQVVVLNSCFPQLLREKKGEEQVGGGEGHGIKGIFSPILPTESVR